MKRSQLENQWRGARVLGCTAAVLPCLSEVNDAGLQDELAGTQGEPGLDSTAGEVVKSEGWKFR